MPQPPAAASQPNAIKPMHAFKSLRPLKAFGSVAVCALLSLCAATAHAERRVALVIGNATYAESPLRNPVNDARDMRDRLLTVGFDKADIVYRENLKRDDIGRTLREFKSKLSADSVALVFYAGHGVQVKGENYLPAVDAHIDGEEDVPQQSLKLGTLMGVLAESKTRLNLVFLDACRNNPYARAFRDGSRGLARARDETPSGTLIAYATRANAVAADGTGRNGVFTSALLGAMAEPGQPIEQVLKKVVRSVRSQTQGAQEPWHEGSLDGDFYFVPGGATAAATRPSPTQLATAQPEPVATPRPNPATPSPSIPQAGQVFKDCSECPEMVVIGTGSFEMGSPTYEAQRDADEGPRHRVNIGREFALGRTHVTVGEFRRFVSATGFVSDAERNAGGDSGCFTREDGKWDWRPGRSWRNPGLVQTEQHPVVCLSWNDAKAYAAWLSDQTGKRYRLPSEAEWEYAARAGTTTPFYTGQTIATDQANFNGNGTYNGSAKGEYRQSTTKVGSFAPNAFGLSDMAGNAWQWIEDAYHENYTGALEDGSAWTTGGDGARRVLRGGSWNDYPQSAGSAKRDGDAPDYRSNFAGFRIARTF